MTRRVPVAETTEMIRQMTPELRPGRYRFRMARDAADLAAALPEAVAMFREDEGVSLIVPSAADAPLAMAWIALGVHSALDGVGLTAAVSAALAEAGIPCNIVAAFHHDHVFVPADRAEEALSRLRQLSQSEPDQDPQA